MIIGEKFIWLHLPKTGGTASAHTLENLFIQNISIDPDTEDAKHDSIAFRFGANTPPSNNKSIFITSRRLPSWLLSDWHHKTVSMGLELPFEPVCSGLFYSLRLGGIWVPADYWLLYFNVAICDDVIRLENLEADANRLIHPFLPAGTPQLQFSKHNSNSYSRHLGDFFSSSDLRRIYTNNPLWSQWEEQIYGDRTTLPLPERLRSLKRRLR